MPIYSYICKVCGSADERHVKFDERDSQVCKVRLVPQQPCPDVPPCGGELNREEISITAKMADNWSRWK